MPLPVDYCPHCCVIHVIGEHPETGESEMNYWLRMEDLEDFLEKENHVKN